MFDVLPLQQSSSWMTLCWFTSVCVSWSFHVWVFVLTAWQHEANRLVAHPVPAVLTVFFIVTDRKSCTSCQRFWSTRVMNLSAALVFSASCLQSLLVGELSRTLFFPHACDYILSQTSLQLKASWSGRFHYSAAWGCLWHTAVRWQMT